MFDWAAQTVNVICDKCNKRYAIADDKVRGKSVKIRCKQCQHLISVQGPGTGQVSVAMQGSGASVSERSLSGAHQASLAVAEHAPVWFAMVKGNQQGPLDLKQLEAKVKAQEISARTYLWKQGMADWKRAVDVPEVSSVFASVSAGATATGPTRSATASAPKSKQSTSLKHDVALANEMPSPSTHGAAATIVEQDPNEGEFEREDKTVSADPEMLRRALAQSSASSQPSLAPAAASDPKALADLSDALFNDPALAPSAEHPAINGNVNEPIALSSEPERPEAAAEGAAGEAKAVDPFDSMGPADPAQMPPPGEATRFFIAKAGVNKRNPPWKVAVFIVTLVGLPVGFTYLLSSLRVIPPVTRTTEDGREIQEPFFSPGGLSSLKDMLTGEAEQRRLAAEAKRRAEAERKRQQEMSAARAIAMATAKPEQADPGKPTTTTATGSGLSQAELQQLYGKTTIGQGLQIEKADKGPINRVEGNKRALASGDGLSDDAAQKVLAQSLPAFNNCIETALRRNPNMKVGKVKLTVTVGPSGTVTGATFSSIAHDTSEWGTCVKERAKRMRFPPFEGDPTDVEVPLIVGVAL